MTNDAVAVITIDGPSGVGKGTLALSLADALGWHLLDSGALYRLTALRALDTDTPVDDDNRMAELARDLPVSFRVDRGVGVSIDLDGRDVTRAIRDEQVSQVASQVAALPTVREALLQRQRDFRKPPGLVADGRDMGTVVFPDAALKLFLTASAEERTRRRVEQLSAFGRRAIFDQIYSDITERDHRDATRAQSPLVPADDAVVIDTSDLSISQVLDRAMHLLGVRGLD